MRKKRVLFILKRRQDYGESHHSNISLSTGLYNSASYMCDMLRENRIESKVVVVTDNNCIDREVTLYRPSHVIIEALWVVPEKFDILHKLHPTVKWVIRLHSNLPFLQNEGIAMNWIYKYYASCLKNEVYLAFNSPRIHDDMKDYFISLGSPRAVVDKRILYLPNYYPSEYYCNNNEGESKECKDKSVLDISCFGAIRPIKNHLIQAIAAIKFADFEGKKLRFHINIGRIEQKGDSTLKNLRDLFSHRPEKYRLIEHEWLSKRSFIRLCSQMDMGMQFSLSETFNIVAADTIMAGVPIVGSKEIPWISSLYTANPTDSNQMVGAMIRTYMFPKTNLRINRRKLRLYSRLSERIWVSYFNKR